MRAILGSLLASLRLCISYYWLLYRRTGQPSTATLGLGGDSHKQGIDFHIILVSRASPVHTVMRNCAKDEGRPFGVAL